VIPLTLAAGIPPAATFPRENMEDFNHEAEAGVVAALTQKALDPDQRVIITSAGKAILLVDSNGSERLSLVENLVRTDLEGRVVQSLTLETEESLIDYTKRGATTSAVLMASIASNVIVAALDYHAADEDRTADQDAYGSHTATLQLRHSLEWNAWAKVDGSMMKQLAFVRFLEENREDIVAPDAGTILDACRDLQALRKVDFRSVVREDSENVGIEYKNEAQVTGHVTLPSEFKLSVPVYFGGPEVTIFALLRWELTDEGQLTLGFKLKRLDRIREAEFKRIVQEASEATGVPAFYGTLGSR
jgi:uncharacterized protein YfdQ (DUF2303 family)